MAAIDEAAALIATIEKNGKTADQVVSLAIAKAVLAVATELKLTREAT